MKNIETIENDLLIGTDVIYYPIKGDHSKFTITKIRSEPWECGDSILIKVNGIAGGVDVDHLSRCYVGLDLANGHDYSVKVDMHHV
ncbi:TPA: hypothetical protein ACVU5P_004182 [Vibrio parahaemolyticus]